MTNLVATLRSRDELLASLNGDREWSVLSLCAQAADEIDRLKRAWDSSFAQALQNGAEANRLREALQEIADSGECPELPQMARDALQRADEPTVAPATDYARGKVNPQIEWVRYPDPPYEFRGDSGQIECPMCNGDGSVYPPTESRTGGA